MRNDVKLGRLFLDGKEINLLKFESNFLGYAVSILYQCRFLKYRLYTTSIDVLRDLEILLK